MVHISKVCSTSSLCNYDLAKAASRRIGLWKVLAVEELCIANVGSILGSNFWCHRLESLTIRWYCSQHAGDEIRREHLMSFFSGAGNKNFYITHSQCPLFILPILRQFSSVGFRICQVDSCWSLFRNLKQGCLVTLLGTFSSVLWQFS